MMESLFCNKKYIKLKLSNQVKLTESISSYCWIDRDAVIQGLPRSKLLLV